MTNLPTVYPSSIARAISAVDEIPVFKELPDSFIRIVVRLIKKIDVRNPRKPIVASRSTLATESGRSVESVQRCIRWLEQKGLIEREQKARAGLRGSSSPITPTQALLDALLLSPEAKQMIGDAKYLAPARPKAKKREFIRIKGHSVPAELAWMCIEGDMAPTLLFKLMGIGKATKNRLSDVVMASKDYLAGLKGKHLYSYIRKLLVKGTSYQERAQAAREELKADEKAQKAESLIGKAFKSIKTGAVYVLQAVNAAMVYKNGSRSFEMIEDRFYDAIEAGNLIEVSATHKPSLA